MIRLFGNKSNQIEIETISKKGVILVDISGLDRTLFEGIKVDTFSLTSEGFTMDIVDADGKWTFVLPRERFKMAYYASDSKITYMGH